MLKPRTIIAFWFPLALSWFLMTFEHPWVQAVISRQTDPQLQLAAFGLTLSLMVMVESPIIMLLATGAALSRNGPSFRLLRRYAILVILWVTFVSLLMGFTPLLDVWLGVIVGVEPHIIEAVRPCVQVMMFWPAMIGWRRFHQGLMISQGNTRPISYGTVIRLSLSAGVAIGLGAITELPGAVVGAWALVASALAEVIYVIFASQKNLRTVLDLNLKPDEKALTYLGAFKFHMPLALTSLMMLLIRPIIERGLAQTPDPEATLAAWAVIFTLLLITRSGGIAWQEAVITLSKSAEASRSLRQFTMVLGGAITGVMAVIAFTPLINLYLGPLMQAPLNIHSLVIVGAQAGVLIPLLTAVQSYYRGMLMRSDATSPIYGAVMLSFVVTAVVMWIGIPMGFEGVVVGTFGLALGLAAEIVVLHISLYANNDRLTLVYNQLATGD